MWFSFESHEQDMGHLRLVSLNLQGDAVTQSPQAVIVQKGQPANLPPGLNKAKVDSEIYGDDAFLL